MLVAPLVHKRSEHRCAAVPWLMCLVVLCVFLSQLVGGATRRVPCASVINIGAAYPISFDYLITDCTFPIGVQVAGTSSMNVTIARAAISYITLISNTALQLTVQSCTASGRQQQHFLSMVGTETRLALFVTNSSIATSGGCLLYSGPNTTATVDCRRCTILWTNISVTVQNSSLVDVARLTDNSTLVFANASLINTFDIDSSGAPLLLSSIWVGQVSDSSSVVVDSVATTVTAVAFRSATVHMFWLHLPSWLGGGSVTLRNGCSVNLVGLLNASSISPTFVFAALSGTFVGSNVTLSNLSVSMGTAFAIRSLCCLAVTVMGYVLHSSRYSGTSNVTMQDVWINNEPLLHINLTTLSATFHAVSPSVTFQGQSFLTVRHCVWAVRQVSLFTRMAVSFAGALSAATIDAGAGAALDSNTIVTTILSGDTRMALMQGVVFASARVSVINNTWNHTLGIVGMLVHLSTAMPSSLVTLLMVYNFYGTSVQSNPFRATINCGAVANDQLPTVLFCGNSVYNLNNNAMAITVVGSTTLYTNSTVAFNNVTFAAGTTLIAFAFCSGTLFAGGTLRHNEARIEALTVNVFPFGVVVQPNFYVRISGNVFFFSTGSASTRPLGACEGDASVCNNTCISLSTTNVVVGIITAGSAVNSGGRLIVDNNIVLMTRLTIARTQLVGIILLRQGSKMHMQNNSFTMVACTQLFMEAFALTVGDGANMTITGNRFFTLPLVGQPYPQASGTCGDHDDVQLICNNTFAVSGSTSLVNLSIVAADTSVQTGGKLHVHGNLAIFDSVATVVFLLANAFSIAGVFVAQWNPFETTRCASVSVLFLRLASFSGSVLITQNYAIGTGTIAPAPAVMHAPKCPSSLDLDANTSLVCGNVANVSVGALSVTFGIGDIVTGSGGRAGFLSRVSVSDNHIRIAEVPSATTAIAAVRLTSVFAVAQVLHNTIRTNNTSTRFSVSSLGLETATSGGTAAIHSNVAIAAKDASASERFFFHQKEVATCVVDAVQTLICNNTIVAEMCADEMTFTWLNPLSSASGVSVFGNVFYSYNVSSVTYLPFRQISASGPLNISNNIAMIFEPRTSVSVTLFTSITATASTVVAGNRITMTQVHQLNSSASDSMLMDCSIANGNVASTTRCAFTCNIVVVQMRNTSAMMQLSCGFVSGFDVRSPAAVANISFNHIGLHAAGSDSNITTALSVTATVTFVTLFTSTQSIAGYICGNTLQAEAVAVVYFSIIDQMNLGAVLPRTAVVGNTATIVNTPTVTVFLLKRLTALVADIGGNVIHASTSNTSAGGWQQAERNELFLPRQTFALWLNLIECVMPPAGVSLMDVAFAESVTTLRSPSSTLGGPSTMQNNTVALSSILTAQHIRIRLLRQLNANVSWTARENVVLCDNVSNVSLILFDDVVGVGSIVLAYNNATFANTHNVSVTVFANVRAPLVLKHNYLTSALTANCSSDGGMTAHSCALAELHDLAGNLGTAACSLVDDPWVEGTNHTHYVLGCANNIVLVEVFVVKFALAEFISLSSNPALPFHRAVIRSNHFAIVSAPVRVVDMTWLMTLSSAIPVVIANNVFTATNVTSSVTYRPFQQLDFALNATCIGNIARIDGLRNGGSASHPLSNSLSVVVVLVSLRAVVSHAFIAENVIEMNRSILPMSGNRSVAQLYSDRERCLRLRPVDSSSRFAFCFNTAQLLDEDRSDGAMHSGSFADVLAVVANNIRDGTLALLPMVHLLHNHVRVSATQSCTARVVHNGLSSFQYIRLSIENNTITAAASAGVVDAVVLFATEAPSFFFIFFWFITPLFQLTSVNVSGNVVRAESGRLSTLPHDASLNPSRAALWVTTGSSDRTVIIVKQNEIRLSMASSSQHHATHSGVVLLIFAERFANCVVTIADNTMHANGSLYTNVTADGVVRSQDIPQTMDVTMTVLDVVSWQEPSATTTPSPTQNRISCTGQFSVCGISVFRIASGSTQNLTLSLNAVDVSGSIGEARVVFANVTTNYTAVSAQLVGNRINITSDVQSAAVYGICFGSLSTSLVAADNSIFIASQRSAGSLLYGTVSAHLPCSVYVVDSSDVAANGRSGSSRLVPRVNTNASNCSVAAFQNSIAGALGALPTRRLALVYVDNVSRATSTIVVANNTYSAAVGLLSCEMQQAEGSSENFTDELSLLVTNNDAPSAFVDVAGYVGVAPLTQVTVTNVTIASVTLRHGQCRDGHVGCNVSVLVASARISSIALLGFMNSIDTIDVLFENATCYHSGLHAIGNGIGCLTVEDVSGVRSIRVSAVSTRLEMFESNPVASFFSGHCIQGLNGDVVVELDGLIGSSAGSLVHLADVTNITQLSVRVQHSSVACTGGLVNVLRGKHIAHATVEVYDTVASYVNQTFVALHTEELSVRVNVTLVRTRVSGNAEAAYSAPFLSFPYNTTLAVTSFIVAVDTCSIDGYARVMWAPVHQNGQTMRRLATSLDVPGTHNLTLWSACLWWNQRTAWYPPAAIEPFEDGYSVLCTSPHSHAVCRCLDTTLTTSLSVAPLPTDSQSASPGHTASRNVSATIASRSLSTTDTLSDSVPKQTKTIEVTRRTSTASVSLQVTTTRSSSAPLSLTSSASRTGSFSAAQSASCPTASKTASVVTLPLTVSSTRNRRHAESSTHVFETASVTNTSGVSLSTSATESSSRNRGLSFTLVTSNVTSSLTVTIPVPPRILSVAVHRVVVVSAALVSFVVAASSSVMTLSSVVVPAVGMSLQVAQLSLRVGRLRSLACMDGGSLVKFDGASSLGSSLIDNPLSLSVPSTVSTAAVGAVIGNVLLMAALPLAVAGVCSIVNALRRHVAGGTASSNNSKLRKASQCFSSSFAVVFAFLHVPTAACAGSLLFSQLSTTLEIVVGIVGLVACVAPAAAMLAVYVAASPLNARMRRQFRSATGVEAADDTNQKSAVFLPFSTERIKVFAQYLTYERCRWKVNVRGTTIWGCRLPSVIMRLFAQVLAGCLTPYSWVILADLAGGQVQGLLMGVAAASPASCASATAVLWCIVVISAALAVTEVILRPRCMIFDCVSTALVSVATVAVAFMAALSDDDEAVTSEALFGAQAALSLLIQVIQVLLRITVSPPSDTEEQQELDSTSYCVNSPLACLLVIVCMRGRDGSLPDEEEHDAPEPVTDASSLPTERNVMWVLI